MKLELYEIGIIIFFVAMFFVLGVMSYSMIMPTANQDTLEKIVAFSLLGGVVIAVIFIILDHIKNQ